ncbi:hypothetical protein [Botrimarina sp.]|uniref:hypothetical protein n=1 Tax=Botrimarina sp. TaxID=2795802 RepID=UPI0032EDBA16
MSTSPPQAPDPVEAAAAWLWRPIRFGARALNLKATARESPERLQALQRRRLRRLLDRAKRGSRYLADKYAGFSAEDARLEDLPTVSKGEIMEHFDEYLTVDVSRREVEGFMDDEANLGRLLRDRFVVSHTSGSTGQPLLLVKDERDVELLFALQASRGNSEELNFRQLVAKMARPVRLAAVVMQPGFYPSGSAFSYMPPEVRRFIEVEQLAFSEPDWVERLCEFAPTHLSTYASILHELARLEEAGETRLGESLRQITNISEALAPEARRRYVELFSADVLDDYAMGECLFLTNGCRDTGGMHVNADWAIVEAVDADNRPVPPGERSAKVLVTNLANGVQPFIRYEVDDAVVMAQSECGCGSRLPLIEKIEGRTSDLFYARSDGDPRPFHPVVLEQAIGGRTGVREFRLTQNQPGRVAIEVEPLDDAAVDAEELEREVDRFLEEGGLKHVVDFDLRLVDELRPDSDGNKFQRIVANWQPE